LSSVVEDWGANDVGGVDGRLGPLVDDWGVNSNDLLNGDVMNDLADGDLWNDLGDLWGDVSVSSYWSKNLLFGDKGFEVSSQGWSDSDRSSMDNWSSLMENLSWGSMDNSGLDWSSNASLNDFSVGNNGSWGSDVDRGVHKGLNLLRSKDWVSNVWNGWLDDGSRESSDHWLGLEVDGFLDWDTDVSDCWGHSSVNNWRGSHDWGGMMDKSSSEGSGRSREWADQTSGGCRSAGNESEDDQCVHVGWM
jgi:hypothetical protein